MLLNLKARWEIKAAVVQLELKFAHLLTALTARGIRLAAICV
jgi:hypothetical protein